MKYINSVREHFAKQPVFTLRDLLIFLSEKDITKNYAHLLIHNLQKRKELVRISRGVYSFKKDPVYWGFAFSPFYYGLQEALSLRNLWEQETIPVIITVKKFRPGIREIAGLNVLVRRIQRKAFFGFEMLKAGDFYVPVSDIEKTLLDFFYFKEHLPEDVLSKLLNKANKKKLHSYLKKYSPRLKKAFKKKLS